jgi:hypothetical protein
MKNIILILLFILSQYKSECQIDSIIIQNNIKLLDSITNLSLQYFPKCSVVLRNPKFSHRKINKDSKNLTIVINILDELKKGNLKVNMNDIVSYIKSRKFSGSKFVTADTLQNAIYFDFYVSGHVALGIGIDLTNKTFSILLTEEHGSSRMNYSCDNESYVNHVYIKSKLLNLLPFRIVKCNIKEVKFETSY